MIFCLAFAPPDPKIFSCLATEKVISGTKVPVSGEIDFQLFAERENK